MIYLFAAKWRGAINIASMRYFDTIEGLEAHVRTQTPQYWEASATGTWHAYRVSNDGTEAKALSLKECRAIGLRSLAIKVKE